MKKHVFRPSLVKTSQHFPSLRCWHWLICAARIFTPSSLPGRCLGLGPQVKRLDYLGWCPVPFRSLLHYCLIFVPAFLSVKSSCFFVSLFIVFPLNIRSTRVENWFAFPPLYPDRRQSLAQVGAMPACVEGEELQPCHGCARDRCAPVRMLSTEPGTK